MFALARALLGLVVVWAGVAWFGIEGAAWGHLLASLVLTAAFLAAVHGRTVPTALSELAVRAYLPSAAGVTVIALAAALCQARLASGFADVVLLVLLTLAALFAYGALCVIDKDDKSLAWSKVKLLWAR
jgi:hypothetical protein